MSDVAAESCTAAGAVDHEFQAYPVREVSLGPITVQRALPLRGRRLIGPWCFLDRFGPLTFDAGTPMDVAPHPHMGLQTVTWLLDGELERCAARNRGSEARPHLLPLVQR
jgi:redox-sensitive bicupin YhaK (pirin superfamily)